MEVEEKEEGGWRKRGEWGSKGTNEERGGETGREIHTLHHLVLIYHCLPFPNHLLV